MTRSRPPTTARQTSVRAPQLHAHEDRTTGVVQASAPAAPARDAISLPALLTAVRACTLCAAHLPLGPRPVLQMHASARILIASQAPGRKVHASGIPFDDASGDRLRAWLGMSRETFYDPQQVALLPMGFCYPGSGHGGDLPPRPECAANWRTELLGRLAKLELTLVIGRYAQAWHLPANGATLTEAVQAWRTHWPHTIVLPHPSPRNTPWLRLHPWFERDLLPLLQARVQQVLAGSAVHKSAR